MSHESEMQDYQQWSTDDLKAEFAKCLMVARDLRAQPDLTEAERANIDLIAEEWIVRSEGIEEILSRRGWDWYPDILEWHPRQPHM